MTLPSRVLVVCETAAVPRRTVQVVDSLSRAADVEVLCWSRLGAHQVPVEVQGRVTLSRGTSLPSFVVEMGRRIRDGAYGAILVADLRLLAAALFWTAGTGTRVVYDRMEIPSVSLALRLRRFLKVTDRIALRAAERLERWLVARAWGLFSVPLVGTARDHVVGLHPRMYWLSNWPSLEEVREPAVRSGGDGTRPFTVLHTGAVGPASGLGVVLRAAALLRDRRVKVRWILVGYPVGITASSAEDEIRRLGLEGEVELRPRVPYAEIPSLLAEADLGLALLDPTDDKFRFVERGMSRKAFTYMAAGLPVVANLPHGLWIAEEGVGVAVAYGDASALADAVGDLAGDGVRRRALGEAGRRAVVARYHWGRQEHAILDLVLGRGEAG